MTFTYDNDYLSFVCSEEKGLKYQMYPYWKGMSDPILFPFYTGSNGISTGTQYPPGYTSPTTATGSGSSSSSNSNSPTHTAKANSDSGSSSDLSTGSIVGIVTGVVSALATALGLAFKVYKWNKGKHRPLPTEEPDPKLAVHSSP